MIGVVIDLYGEGLRRIFATLEGAGEATEAVREALAADGVVASLMLIHDLYPVEIEQRVEEALDSVRPYMESHGGDVELLGVDEGGVARIRLAGSCDGCPASAATLELAIKQALDEHAPDLTGLEVEGMEAAAGPELGADALALPVVQAGPGAADGNGNGAAAGGLAGHSRAAVLVPGGRARGPRGGLVADDDARRPRAARRQRRRLAARLHGQAARTVAPGSARARWSRASSAAPAAGGATFCRGPAAPWTTTACSSTPCRLLARDGSVRVALAG